MAHYGQGLLYNALKQPDASISELRAALDYAPDNHELHAQTALIAIKLKKPQAALEILEKSYNYDHKSYKRSINLAAAYQVTGHTQQAIRQYKKSLKLDDSQAYAYASLAGLYFNTGETDKAFTTLKQGKKQAQDPKFLEAYLYEQSKQFLAKEDLKRAIAGFKLLAEWDKDKRAQLYQLIGELFIAQNNETEAVNILRKATLLPTPIVDNFIMLSAIYLQHNPEKSLKLMKKARAKFPDNQELLFATGYLYSDIKQYAESIPFFEAAKSNTLSSVATNFNENPLTEDFYLYYGGAYERIGNIQKAEEIFEEGLHIYPRCPPILNYLAYMWSEAGIKLDKALIYINRALVLTPNNPAYIDTRGWIYFKQNKLKKALAELKKAHKMIGDDPEVLLHLGDTYYAAKNRDKAIEYWKKSYTLDPKNKITAHKLIEQGINLPKNPNPNRNPNPNH
jgi:tetratricopeptide (TPR) repeat protein